MRNTGLFDEIGQAHIFANEDQALAAIYEWLGEDGKDDLFCAVSKRSLLEALHDGAS
jgi:SulP family sulfate permease